MIFSITASSLARVTVPLERFGDGAVVLAEVHQLPGELGEGREVVRGRALRCTIEKYSSIWFSQEGVHREVDQPRVRVRLGDPA